MKYMKLIALFVVCLFIGMPIAFAEQYSQYEEELETEPASNYENESNSSLPADSCKKKANASSSIADLMDNGIMEILNMIVMVSKSICDMASKIDTILATLAANCCWADKIPIIGQAVCTPIELAYEAWNGIYGGYFSFFCCITNCKWCEGKNCLRKLKEATGGEGEGEAADGDGADGDGADGDGADGDGADGDGADGDGADGDGADGDGADGDGADGDGADGEKSPDGDESKGFLGLDMGGKVKGIAKGANDLFSTMTAGEATVEGSGGLKGVGRSFKAGAGATSIGHTWKDKEGNVGQSLQSDLMASGMTPYDNIYASAACICPQGILYNLQKLETIYDAHECCVEKACNKGISTEACDKMLDQATCMYWEGGILKTLMGVVVGIVNKIITNVIKEQLISRIAKAVPFLQCALALWDLTNIPGMMSSLGSSFKNIDGGVDCGEMDFKTIENKEDLQSSAKDRAEYFTEESGASFSYGDEDGDGIYESFRVAEQTEEGTSKTDQGPEPRDLSYGDGEIYKESPAVKKVDRKDSDKVYYFKTSNTFAVNTEQMKKYYSAKLAMKVVGSTIGKAVDEWVREKCEADWAASEPTSDDPQNHHSEPATSDPDYVACEGEKTIITTAQITGKKEHPDGDYTYDYTHTITNCDMNVTFDIKLRNCVGEDCEYELVANGTSHVGYKYSRNNNYTTSGNYDEICLDTTNTNPLCSPFYGTVEQVSTNQEESETQTNMNDQEECTFNYTSSVSQSSNGYAWSFTLHPCSSFPYTIAFGNQERMNSNYVDFGTTTRNSPISKSGVRETDKHFTKMCLSGRDNGMNCEYVDGSQTSSTPSTSSSPSSSTQPELSVEADITKSGDNYDGSYTVQAGDSPITYWARLKDDSSGDFLSLNSDGYSLSAGQSQENPVSITDDGGFNKFCVETSDDSFGSNGIKCYDI